MIQIQHDPSEKPREFPSDNLTVRPSIHQVGVATVKGTEMHYIYMANTCYEYEEVMNKYFVINRPEFK
jgi:hypothetical protein